MDPSWSLDDLNDDFEYTDTNESHKWLFSYPGKLSPDPSELKTSVTKLNFCEPPPKTVLKTGKRKKILENFYRQIIADEIKADFDPDKTTVEPYETDYSGHFKNPDDMPIPGEQYSKNEMTKKNDGSCPSKDPEKQKIEELKLKYPLYASRSFSFAAQTYGKDQFRKKYNITRPLDQNYDNVEY